MPVVPSNCEKRGFLLKDIFLQNSKENMLFYCFIVMPPPHLNHFGNFTHLDVMLSHYMPLKENTGVMLTFKCNKKPVYWLLDIKVYLFFQPDCSCIKKERKSKNMSTD